MYQGAVVKINMGIHLTGVATTYSVLAYGRLPQKSLRAGISVWQRGDLSRVSVRPALARWLPVPTV